MSVDELLQQLRGIEAPLEPGWWPLAPAWWVLIIASTASLLLTLILVKRRRDNREFERVNREFHRISSLYTDNRDEYRLLLNLSRWLRRVSLMAFPESNIAGITGVAWLEFLDQVMGEAQFSRGPGQVFASAVYSRAIDIDHHCILALCEAWMTSLKPHLKNRAGA